MDTLDQNRDPQLITNRTGTIGFYEREFYPFSNFSSFQVAWRGTVWQTSEHAYHAAKFFGVRPDLVARIGLCRSAHDAFKFAHTHASDVVEGWPEMRIPIMTDICRHKLGQHAYIRAKLLATGDWTLVEDSPKDPFWGIGADGQGRNELGTIWMKLREELRNGEIDIQA